MSAPGSVLVIGAGGALGSAMSGAFESAGWRVIRATRNGRNGSRELDLDRPESLESIGAGADLVINPVAHPGLPAERAILRDGGRLINVSAQPARFGQQLRGEESAGRGTVILNAGRIPGLTSLMAADLLARNPEADRVEIATTLSARGSSGPQGGAFVHEHLSAQSHHATRLVPFPDPFRDRRCLEFAEEERGWIGALSGEREVSCLMCMAEAPLQRVLLALNGVRVLGALPRFAFTLGRGAPKKLTTEPVAMWVGVRRRGELLGASTALGNGDYRSTASITRVLSEAVLDRAGELPTGVLDIEEAFELDELRPRLASAGIELGQSAAQPSVKTR